VSGYELAATGVVCLTLLLFTVIVRRRRHVEIKLFGFLRIMFGDSPPPPPSSAPAKPVETKERTQRDARKDETEPTD
jgi:hypothetical protein